MLTGSVIYEFSCRFCYLERLGCFSLGTWLLFLFDLVTWLPFCLALGYFYIFFILQIIFFLVPPFSSTPSAISSFTSRCKVRSGILVRTWSLRRDCVLSIWIACNMRCLFAPRFAPNYVIRRIRSIYKLTHDRLAVYLQSGSFFQFVGIPIL